MSHDLYKPKTKAMVDGYLTTRQQNRMKESSAHVVEPRLSVKVKMKVFLY